MCRNKLCDPGQLTRLIGRRRPDTRTPRGNGSGRCRERVRHPIITLLFRHSDSRRVRTSEVLAAGRSGPLSLVLFNRGSGTRRTSRSTCEGWRLSLHSHRILNQNRTVWTGSSLVPAEPPERNHVSVQLQQQHPDLVLVLVQQTSCCCDPAGLWMVAVLCLLHPEHVTAEQNRSNRTLQ